MRVSDLRRIRNRAQTYAGFAGTGYNVFPGGPEFQDAWSYEDFNRGEGWINGPSYKGAGVQLEDLTLATRDRAGFVVGKLSDDYSGLNDASRSRMEELLQLIRTAITEIDIKTRQHSFGNRTPQVEGDRIRAMNRIVRAIKEIAGLKINSAPGTSTGSTSSTTPSTSQLANSLVRNNQSLLPTPSAGASLPSWLPFAVGGGALVLMLGIFGVVQVSKSRRAAPAVAPVSGYRKRRYVS